MGVLSDRSFLEEVTNTGFPYQSPIRCLDDSFLNSNTGCTDVFEISNSDVLKSALKQPDLVLEELNSLNTSSRKMMIRLIVSSRKEPKSAEPLPRHSSEPDWEPLSKALGTFPNWSLCSISCEAHDGWRGSTLRLEDVQKLMRHVTTCPRWDINLDYAVFHENCNKGSVFSKASAESLSNVLRQQTCGIQELRWTSIKSNVSTYLAASLPAIEKLVLRFPTYTPKQGMVPLLLNENMLKVSKLRLERQVLDSTMVQHLLTIMKSKSELTSLSLSTCCRMRSEDWMRVIRALGKSPKLNEIEFPTVTSVMHPELYFFPKRNISNVDNKYVSMKQFKPEHWKTLGKALRRMKQPLRKFHSSIGMTEPALHEWLYDLCPADLSQLRSLQILPLHGVSACISFSRWSAYIPQLQKLEHVALSFPIELAKNSPAASEALSWQRLISELVEGCPKLKSLSADKVFVYDWENLLKDVVEAYNANEHSQLEKLHILPRLDPAPVDTCIDFVRRLKPMGSLKDINLIQLKRNYMTDEQMADLLKSVRTNFSLQSLRLPIKRSSNTRDKDMYTENDLPYELNCILTLNSQGRSYMIEDTANRKRGVELLIETDGNCDRLFLHLRENPVLCDRKGE